MEDLEFKRLWLRMILVALFLLCGSRHLNGQMLLDEDIEDELRSNSSGMHLRQNNKHVVMSNGIVRVTLTVPGGMVTNLTYKGSENLLETHNRENDRGYWDVTWMKKPGDRGTQSRLLGTTYRVMVQNLDQIEISFQKIWELENEDTIPLNIDMRYVILRNSPGFYTYAILERNHGWPAFVIQEGRIVFKPQGKKFHYMAMSDTRQRIMPTDRDRDTGKVLDYPEAVLLTNPSNPHFRGEVDDKYYYSCKNKDNKVHGWVSNDQVPVGMWMITPSNEFRTGGPFKQELTSHVGPTMLAMFISRHYAGKDIDLNFQSGEYWKKVLGPVFIYFNSDASAKSDPSVLWEDAKRRMREEEARWPYSFPFSIDFLKSKQRGSVEGRLLVQDNKLVAGASSYVGLAAPGDVGSWQLENKGYQFWTQTDAKGNFQIKNVIPGTYSLFAWIPGTLGDYKHVSDLTIKSGSIVKVKDMIFVPPRIGATLWEIGIPDRTAAEFFIPDPLPSYIIHEYKDPVEKFREYGLWKRYNDLYPERDLVYNVRESDYRKDWFYAQVTRGVGNGKFKATTWEIHFNLENVARTENYTMQLALASASGAELQVHINDRNTRPYFTTGFIGRDNAVARHGIHGLYYLYSIGIQGNQFVEGKNVIFLTQARAEGPFRAVMYDYIRLEGPAQEDILSSGLTV